MKDFLLLIMLLINFVHLTKIKDLEKRITQERNDSIVFCVEKPTDCKKDYLKLKETQK